MEPSQPAHPYSQATPPYFWLSNQTFDLSSLKLTMDSSSFKVGQVHFTDLAWEGLSKGKYGC